MNDFKRTKYNLVLTSEDGKYEITGQVEDVGIKEAEYYDSFDYQDASGYRPINISAKFVPGSNGRSYTLKDLDKVKQLEVLKSVGVMLKGEFSFTTARVEEVRRQVGAPKEAYFTLANVKKKDKGTYIIFTWEEKV